MADTFEEIENRLDHITKEMDYLNHYQVVIGFFSDENSLLLTIVRANEYGAHIRPKNSSGFLWIPSRQAIKEFGKNVTAKDVRNKYQLFIPKGKHIAAVNQDSKLVTYFYLMQKVDIPARAFIRKTGIDYRQKYRRYIKAGIEKLGRMGVSDMREVMRRWTKPGNAPLTIDNKRGANNPLVDTGQLQKRITWKILPMTGGTL